MTIYRPHLALLAKLSNSFVSYHYDAIVDVVQKARYPKTEEEETAFLSKMSKANVQPYPKNTPNPYDAIRKVSDCVVSVGAKLTYVKKMEAVMRRGGNEGTYHPEVSNKGMFPVFSELLYVSNDLQTMYFTVYQASMGKTVWLDGNGKSLKKENVVQFIKDTKPFNSMCNKKENNTIKDADGFEIYQKNEDGTLLLDDHGNPMTMTAVPIRRVKIQNADVSIKGKKIQFVTDEIFPEEELIAIRDAYWKKMAEKAAAYEAEKAKAQAENK